MAASPLIIGIGHRRRVGKDYLASLIKAELVQCGISTIIHPAARLTKETAHQLFARYGLMDADYYDKYPHLKAVNLPLLNKTPRDVWIAHGAAMRTVHTDFWVDGMLNHGKRALVQIVPDVRFEEEASAILDRGGFLIKVDAPGVPKDVDGADEVLEGYREWTYEVTNDFKPKTMQRAAEDLADVIKEKLNVQM